MPQHDPSRSRQGKGNARTLFQATITADVDVFASLDDLDIDFMPTRERLSDTTWRATAVVELDQIKPIVAAGAVVELQRLIDPVFPRDRIMSSEDANKQLRTLERHFRSDD